MLVQRSNYTDRHESDIIHGATAGQEKSPPTEDTGFFSARSASNTTEYRHIELGSGDPFYQKKGYYYDVLTRNKIVPAKESQSGSLSIATQPRHSTAENSQMASPADGLSTNRSNYSKDHYDNNRDRFKVLEWTLERLINKTGLKKLEVSSKEKPDFERLTLYLNDIDQTPAPLHLDYHIQSSHPKLTERIKINTSIPAKNSLSPNTLAELKPHSVHLTYSDFIIPEQLTKGDHKEYLHSKITQIIELASLCTETDDEGLIYIYNYLKEPELYHCVEPGVWHPYGHPIIGEIPKYQGDGDDSLAAALQETFGEEINIALIKPCPCLYRQENTCTHPGNPPDNDNIYIDSDDSDEDIDTD